MPNDMNGNELAPGHCKVHPEIEEQYPCHECRGESAPKRRRRRKADDDADAAPAEDAPASD